MEVESEASCSPSSASASGGSREYKVVMLGAGGVGKSVTSRLKFPLIIADWPNKEAKIIQFKVEGSGAHGAPRKQTHILVEEEGIDEAMTMQFISHQFPDYHDPTIEDAYKTQVRIDNEPAYLDILDTAGQAEFTAMREQYMRGGEGFIVCYSVTDRQSFQEAAKFKELIFQVRHTYEIPLVLVGNKIDLEQFRQVSTEEGVGLAREYSCAFFETSAALRFCIDDAFHGLVREIRKKESVPSLKEKKLKRKDSLWKKLKGSLKKKRENMT